MTKQTDCDIYQFLKSGEIEPRGWLRNQIKVDADGFYPEREYICPEIRKKPFKNRLWHKENEYGDPTWWDGEVTGWWIDGMVRLAHLSGDPQLKQQVENFFDNLMASQDPNGYIGLISKDSPNRWSEGCSELWPQSHIYRAMLSQYDFTGKREILNSLMKSAELTSQKFDKGKTWMKGTLKTTDYLEPGDTTNTHAIMIVEPMLELYNRSGEERFLKFAKNMVETGEENDPFLRNMWQEALSGHGVHVVEHLRIPALLYSYTGEDKYLEVSEKTYDIMENKYLSSNGAPRSDEWIADGAPSNKANEYCDIVEWMITTSQLFAITGNNKYADSSEKVVFNAAQGAREPGGLGIQYLSFPNQTEALKGDWHGEYAYRPNHYPGCCPSIAGRLIPYFVERSWVKKPDRSELLVNSYSPVKLTTKLGQKNRPVNIKVATNYPFEENASIRVETQEELEFCLSLRMPEWCEEARIRVDGVEVSEELKVNEIYRLNQKWDGITEIEIQLKMPIYTSIDEDNLVTVNRGPLVYGLPIPSDEKYFDHDDIGVSAKGYTARENSDWRYALVLDKENPGSSISVEKNDFETQYQPWVQPPIKLKARGIKVPNWGEIEAKGTPATLRKRLEEREMPGWIGKENRTGGVVPEIPESPLEMKRQVEQIELVPYGFTRLRISSFPVVYQS